MLKEFTKKKGKGILLYFIVTLLVVLVLGYFMKWNLAGLAGATVLLYIGDFFIEYSAYRKEQSGQGTSDAIKEKLLKKKK